MTTLIVIIALTIWEIVSSKRQERQRQREAKRIEQFRAELETQYQGDSQQTGCGGF